MAKAHDNTVLASISLFKELYNSKKDIYNVITEFIKAAIISESIWSFNTTEAKQLLEKVFDFNLPEPVIKSTLKNEAKSGNVFTYNNGYYTLNPNHVKQESSISEEFETSKQNYSKIIESLFFYIETNYGKDLTTTEKNEINIDFNSYLLGNAITDKNLKYISSFIVINQLKTDFTESLNTIKEGLILYKGVTYINDLGSWDNNLTIFLDTEHLFNVTGYNGSVYQEMFNDFYKLVQEINSTSINKTGSKKIDLRYFPEIKKEVDGFFFVAEKILDGKSNLDPSKTAMATIVNGCKVISDVVSKKANFFQELQTRGISLWEDNIDYYANHSYNVEDQTIMNEAKKLSQQNDKYFDEDECLYLLKLFTKIRTLRKGRRNTSFEKVGYILLTGKSAGRFLAYNPLVKDDKDFPFATDMDYVTDKFWFKLKKGFNSKDSLPKSFDIITKAQIALASQINSSISKEYLKLIDQVNRGELSADQAKSINFELRERLSKPEDIVPDSVEESISILNGEGFENYLREKSILKEKADKGELAIKELAKRKFIEQKKQKSSKKRIVSTSYGLITISFVLLIIILPIIVGYLIAYLKTNNDTPIAVLGIAITCIIEILGCVKFIKPLNKRLKSKARQKYLELITRVNKFN